MKPSPFRLTAWKLIVLTVVGILSGDVWLLRRRRESVSSWAGRHFLIVTAVFTVLLMHFKGWPRFMRKLDVFAASARQIRSHTS